MEPLVVHSDDEQPTVRLNLGSNVARCRHLVEDCAPYGKPDHAPTDNVKTALRSLGSRCPQSCLLTLEKPPPRSVDRPLTPSLRRRNQGKVAGCEGGGKSAIAPAIVTLVSATPVPRRPLRRSHTVLARVAELRSQCGFEHAGKPGAKVPQGKPIIAGPRQRQADQSLRLSQEQ